uniref:E3 ubiquitin-protein ligase makorin-2 n=1 Tax=Callorhinchus milii TaxID=7868 RepID=A0A4W3I3T8_CALMI
MHGVCREGSRCLFSHDLSTSKPSTICKFYQKGLCAYGVHCRYDHVKLPGFRAVAPAIPRVVPVSVTHNAVPVPVCVEPVVPVKATEPTRYKKKPLELKDRGPVLPDVAGFVFEKPPPPSYLAAVRSGLDHVPGPVMVGGGVPQQLCPFAAAGQCNYGETCLYLHGERCDVCGLQVLHPTDLEQRREHEQLCLRAFEQDMEKAFAVQKSEDKVCNICMEVVYEKPILSERRFGILSDCIHPYCLSCIRQWRCAKQFENKIIKSCPECRVVSEFVIPSAYWVEEQEEKERLIEAFKQGMSKKSCKYFNQGKGSCPFGGKCLYLHAYPDGTLAQPELPRKQLSSEGNVRFLHSVRLWDFIEEREQRDVLPPREEEEEEEEDMAELSHIFSHLSGTSERGESQAEQAVLL